MVPRDQIFCWFGDERWYSDVIPGFGVFRDDDIVLIKSESFYLVFRCCCGHEEKLLGDPVVLVDIHVVAESDGKFLLLGVLVDVADPHVGDGSDPSDRPVVRDMVPPLTRRELVV